MIKIKQVYKADNGDVFFLKETDYGEHTQDEINELMAEAKKMYENNEYKECKYKNGVIFEIGSYYDNDKFLGNEQIHILNGYSVMQDGIYLKYTGKLKSLWSILEIDV